MYAIKPELLYDLPSPECIVSYNDDCCQQVLPIDTYRFWFNALREGNVDMVSDVLSAASKTERNKLINGVFDYMEEDHKVTYSIGTDCGLRKPLAVCISYCSFEVLSILIEYGVFVEFTDGAGNNILHLMVRRVLIKPFEEEKVLNIYK